MERGETQLRGLSRIKARRAGKELTSRIKHWDQDCANKADAKQVYR